MTSCIDDPEPLAVDFAIDLTTRTLAWAYTDGLAWYGCPELAARVPPGDHGDEAALAVFLATALINLGKDLLALDWFQDPEEIGPYTACLLDEAVTVWIAGPADLTDPVPKDLVAEDVYLVSCSLWDRPPGDRLPSMID
jgi:hypothetical protein